MSTSINAILGVSFLVLAIAATYLMFWLWGYPYDKENRRSSAPQWKMNIHRAVGFAYVAVYVLLMIQMVPRLWTYQVEFPARTVVHISVGLIIGVLLVVKISIIRFFRHLEELMPALGIAILVCTFVLTGMSLPFVFKQRALVAAAPGGSAFSEASLARVERLLPEAELPGDADLAALARADALEAGQAVLLGKCVFCHDLRTVIARPRTPRDWQRTVARMLEKPTLGEPISAVEGYQVTAFLVAITPDLQKSAQARREQQLDQAEAKKAAMAMSVAAGPKTETETETEAETETGAEAETEAETETDAEAGGEAKTDAEARTGTMAAMAAEFDPAEARELYEDECSLCHELSEVDDAPPTTAAEVDELVNRMIDNGLDLEPDPLAKIKWHLVRTFVK